MSDKQQNTVRTPTDAATLRKQAEEQARTMEPTVLSAQTPEEFQRVIHELRVHQIELEIQNEELRTAQAQIETGRERYFDLYDQAPAGYCTVSVEGLILEVNLTAATLLGVTRSAMVKRPLSRFILKEDQNIYYLHRKQLFETGEPQEFELRLIKPDGAFLWAHLAATAAQGEDGAPVCRVTLTDITRLKRAEEENRRFRTIADNSVYGKAIADLQGNLLYVNRFYADIHGYSPDELIGRHFSLLHSREQMAAADRLIASMIREGHFAPTTVWHRHQDGTEFPLLMSGVLIKDDYGTPQCIATSAIDMSAQYQAEAKLAESEGILRDIVESTLSGFWDWNLVDNTEYLSPTFKRMFGYEDREMESSPEAWQKIIFPEDLPGVLEVFDRHIKSRGREPFYNEIRYRHRDGSTVWVICAGRVIEWAEDGTAIRMAGCHIDITGRKRAEDALRESVETHRALVEGLPDTVIRFDREGRHLFVSDNVREVVDIEAAQFIGKTHAELGFPRALCHFWEESIQQVFDSGTPFETEFTFAGKTGTTTFNWRLVPERNAQGAVSSVLTISRDITAQRHAEQEYKTLFSEMLDGFALHEIVCDAEGEPADYRFLAVNPAFERMTGLKAEAIVGRTVLEVKPGTEKHWIETFGKVALSGEPVFFENYAVELGKHFEVTAFRPFAGRFASIFQDITERKLAEEERKKLQEQLIQAQKMETVGQLAGGVAHDFNNMLGVILGYAEMILEKVPAGQPMYKALRGIQQAAQRSADLTRQLLTFARKQTIAPRRIDLNETVAGMLKMLRRLIGEDIDLIWLPGQDLHPVKMDPTQIDQILANLCVNARDAIKGVGKITIETSLASFDEAWCAVHTGVVPGEYVLLAVSDNGCGMDQQTVSHLFEPFFTTKEQGKGTGLGLASVYGAVTQNKGFINVDSEPGQGTTFKIYLPRYLARTESLPIQDAAGAAPRGHETILLVEDEPTILKMTIMMLELQGYTVVPAGSPEEAIRLAGEYPGGIDLLITDVVMPKMNGLDLAQNILSVYPDMKCLFMSGYTANIIAHHGVLDAKDHFIQKPFSKKDLAARVRNVLDNRDTFEKKG